MKKFTGLLWGLCFIIIGTILITNELELTSINLFFNGWWTLFIIIPCFVGLFQEKNKTGNLIGITIGILLLLSIQNIISFDLIMKLLLPIIFISIGIGIIFNDFINNKIKQKIKELNKDNKEEYYATFSEQKIKLQKENFKGASLNAIFGSIKFDMSEAILEKDEILNASSIFRRNTNKSTSKCKYKS